MLDCKPSRRLLICSVCELSGVREILAEVDSNGHIIVMRHHGGYTTIVGSEFEVRCGKCGATALYKTKPVVTSNPSYVSMPVSLKSFVLEVIE